MDIDGGAERNGRHLFLETKETGVPLKQGQEIFYKALAKKPGCTVFVIEGQPQQPEFVQVMTEGRLSRRAPCDLDKLRKLVRHWYDTSDRGGHYHINDEDLDS